MKSKRIVSTVILSLILSILLIFVLNNLTLDPRKEFENMQPNESIEDYGEMSMLIIAVGGLGIIVASLVFLTLFANAAITAGICLIFSIKNRKSCLKSIRIINYVLDGGFSFVIGVSVIKIILFFCGH